MRLINSAGRTTLLVCLVIVTVGAACGPSSGDDPPTVDAITVQGEERYPMDTLAEARSFSSAWAVVEVKSETAGSVAGGGAQHGEGYASRSVELDVKSVVWKADSSVAIPDTINPMVTGYAVRDGNRIPMILEGAERMELGKEYLVGLIAEPEGITLASPRAVFSMTDDVVTASEEGHGRGPLADTLGGLNAEEAGQALADATPAVSDSVGSFDDRLEQYND